MAAMARAPPSHDAPDGGLPRGDGGALLVSSPPPTGGRETCLAMMRRPVLLMVYAHFTLNIQVTGLAEGFPLFALRASWRNATDIAGGDGIDGASTALVDNGVLGLTPPDIGRALISLSLTLVISPILYPVLEKRIGHIGNLRCGLLPSPQPASSCLSCAALSACLVAGGSSGGPRRYRRPPRLRWADDVLRGQRAPQRPPRGAHRLLQWPCHVGQQPRARGRPPAIGAIYAHVTPTRRHPLDYHLPFFLLALLALATASLVATAIAGPRRSRFQAQPAENVGRLPPMAAHLRWRK